MATHRRVPVKVLLFGHIRSRKSRMNGSDCAARPVFALVARLYSAEIRGMKSFTAFQCGSKNVTDTPHRPQDLRTHASALSWCVCRHLHPSRWGTGTNAPRAILTNARRTHVPAPADPDIEQRLTDLVKPAVFAELAYYRQLGLRSRLLDLPVMGCAGTGDALASRAGRLHSPAHARPRAHPLGPAHARQPARALRTLSDLPGGAV